MGQNQKFRIEVKVKLIPLDVSLPVSERVADEQYDLGDKYFHRAFAILKASTLASKMPDRLMTEVFGEKPL